MAEFFKWIRPGYELVKVKLEWNIRVPHLETVHENEEEFLVSQETASELTPYSHWKLLLIGDGHHLKIRAIHLDSEGISAKIVDPVLVKFAIVNGKGQKVLEQLVSSQPKESWVQILLPKNKINIYLHEYIERKLNFLFIEGRKS